VSWVSSAEVAVSIGLGIGDQERVDLSVNRAEGVAYLVLGALVAEIRLERVHLETLREQLPDALAKLGTLEAAEDRAGKAGNSAEDLAACLRDQADAADAAGEHERAGELRATADTLTATVSAVDAALDEVNRAALEADDATERARTILCGETAAQSAPRLGLRPADLVYGS
jgi:hypothetical protein